MTYSSGVHFAVVIPVRMSSSLPPWHVSFPLYTGLLDIFGFENCGSNSLEQLCINFANERLQHHYVQHMVEAERQLFEREGLTMESPAVVDNAACLALLAGPVSIFNLLNEDSRCVDSERICYRIAVWAI